jgi:hypothetical protein
MEEEDGAETSLSLPRVGFIGCEAKLSVVGGMDGVATGLFKKFIPAVVAPLATKADAAPVSASALFFGALLKILFSTRI